MSKIDPGLRFLSSSTKAQIRELALESNFVAEAVPRQPSTATVLLQFAGDLAEIEALGFKTRSVAGDVAVGELELAKLDDLEENENVLRVEATRILHRDLDIALPEIQANAVHSGPPGNRGSGVIVGIVDSGIDYQHQSFRGPDGTSRILAIWDQGLTPQGGESSPAGFGYGVEYTKTEIDAALATADPLTTVRHQDLAAAGYHGTHVAGIAAGDGSVGTAAAPPNTYIGVAPEADIVLVANTRGRASGELGLGDSADTLDAIRYIFDLAAELRRPVVINQSQGDNVGPHDGTSLLERGIDNMLGEPGRSMVKSAGNEGSAYSHASGLLALGESHSPSINMPGRPFPVIIDIWYRGADRFSFSITPPGGAASSSVTPGSTVSLNLPNGNKLFVDSVLSDPGNNDNRIFVMIQRGSQATIQPGVWHFTLHGTAVNLGQWDAWIQRGLPRPQFRAPFMNPARSISVPGTAKAIITAASYITNGAGVGSRSSFSSLGPTRDGRQAPTLAAPGEWITSAQPGDSYDQKRGTSMAAPMISGTIALMLERNSDLTQQQIKDCLTGTARADGFTGTTPNNAWGAGKLDALAAFRSVALPSIPPEPPVVPPETPRPPWWPPWLWPPWWLLQPGWPPSSLTSVPPADPAVPAAIPDVGDLPGEWADYARWADSFGTADPYQANWGTAAASDDISDLTRYWYGNPGY